MYFLVTGWEILWHLCGCRYSIVWHGKKETIHYKNSKKRNDSDGLFHDTSFIFASFYFKFKSIITTAACCCCIFYFIYKFHSHCNSSKFLLISDPYGMIKMTIIFILQVITFYSFCTDSIFQFSLLLEHFWLIVFECEILFLKFFNNFLFEEIFLCFFFLILKVLGLVKGNFVKLYLHF